MAAVNKILHRVPGLDRRYWYDSQAFGNSDTVACPDTNTGTLPITLSLFRLLSVLAVNKGSALLWLQFFDAATLPGNGTTPVLIPLPLNGAGSFASYTGTDAPQPGADYLYAYEFRTGVTWAASTTAATLTVDATSSVWVNLQYQ